MYFFCEERGREWWVCDGILENGFHFGQHICSSPAWAPGDLYRTRTDRQAALAAIFPGVQFYVGETVILTKDTVGQWNALADPAVQESLKPLYEKYKELLGGSQTEPKIELTFTE